MMADKVIVTLALDRQTDRDLLHWLDAQANKSAAIRAALREYLARGSVTLGDVFQAIKDLERKVQAGAVVVAGAGPADQVKEPPDAAAALDALANL
jgi:hypothetical protein